jgi:hypothetical protein
MQLISIQILNIMHNTLASINYKGTRISRFGMHRGLPCSKEILKSVKLHKVVPRAPMQQPPSRVENLHGNGSYMR